MHAVQVPAASHNKLILFIVRLRHDCCFWRYLSSRCRSHIIHFRSSLPVNPYHYYLYSRQGLSSLPVVFSSQLSCCVSMVNASVSSSPNTCISACVHECMRACVHMGDRRGLRTFSQHMLDEQIDDERVELRTFSESRHELTSSVLKPVRALPRFHKILCYHIVWYNEWTHGCMDAWMHGCMDACMHGCMDAGMHGCMDAWMHTCDSHGRKRSVLVHACVHMFLCTCVHVNAHVCVCVCVHVHAHVNACACEHM